MTMKKNVESVKPLKIAMKKLKQDKNIITWLVNMCSEIKEKRCAFTECITSPCENQRPPQTREGFCVAFNDGKKRNAIVKKRVGGKQT